MRWCLLGFLALFAGSGGERGTVEGRIVVHRGDAPADTAKVVVYVVGFTEAPPAAAAEIRQEGKRFLPELLPITAGQWVSFPNGDPVFHNVFSPSSTHKFDLGQYPQGETKRKRFPEVGVVDVFCNIHPQMAATILVLPNRRWVEVGGDGTFHIDDIPPGHWTLYAYSRRATEPVSAEIDVAPGRATRVSLTLDETQTGLDHRNKFGEKYRDPEKYR